MQTTIIDLGKDANGNTITIGGQQLAIMAGPCAVESQEQMDNVATALNQLGVHILRGGAFKPRTSPHSFQGLGAPALKILSTTAKKHGMKVVTEILDIRDIELIEKHTDIFQVGTRNMSNFNLLKELGKTSKAILLKRGMSATVKELLLAADHIMMSGNTRVILCERGIRTFETETRNTLTLATVPLVKELSHLPIIVDPSHATGKPSLVAPMTKAAIACGADGMLIDVHPNPTQALCDGDQAITPAEFAQLLKELKPIAQAVGRTL